MFSTLPVDAFEFMNWNWSQIKPYYVDLEERPINDANVANWLSDWSCLKELLDETFNRLYVAKTVDTTDEQAEERYNTFLDEIYPQYQAADQNIKEKLLKSGLEPLGFEMPMQNIRSEAQIFRQENLPLLSEELKLGNEYDKIIGAQTITWDEEEITLTQLRPVYQETDRDRREQAWRLASQPTTTQQGRPIVNVRKMSPFPRPAICTFLAPRFRKH